jgi:ribosomal protein S18 acetylase RimI-like enzyme
VPQDNAGPVELAGRDRILAATGHHPYARLTTASREPREPREPRGFAQDGVTAWIVCWSRGLIACALGGSERAAGLLSLLASRGELSGVRRVNLPRVDHAVLAAHLPVTSPDDWDFRWTRTAPPGQPGQDRVAPLARDDDPMIVELLERAFPSTFTRPGDAMVRCWYGVRDGIRLVACGADRSRGGVGSISAVAVDPAVRGQGVGTALIATMTRELLADCDVVTLGVMADNHSAGRLYQRLGYVHTVARTSAMLAG